MIGWNLAIDCFGSIKRSLTFYTEESLLRSCWDRKTLSQYLTQWINIVSKLVLGGWTGPFLGGSEIRKLESRWQEARVSNFSI